MKYNIQPVTDTFNGIVQDTAVKVEIEITYNVGDTVVNFRFNFYNTTGGLVRMREQPIPSSLLGTYSDAGAKKLAEETQGITIID